MAKSMKLDIETSLVSPCDFDAAILQPLRVQAMGSIMVKISSCHYENIILRSINRYIYRLYVANQGISEEFLRENIFMSL